MDKKRDLAVQITSFQETLGQEIVGRVANEVYAKGGSLTEIRNVLLTVEAELQRRTTEATQVEIDTVLEGAVRAVELKAVGTGQTWGNPQAGLRDVVKTSARVVGGPVGGAIANKVLPPTTPTVGGPNDGAAGGDSGSWGGPPVTQQPSSQDWGPKMYRQNTYALWIAILVAIVIIFRPNVGGILSGVKNNPDLQKLVYPNEVATATALAQSGVLVPVGTATAQALVKAADDGQPGATPTPTGTPNLSQDPAVLAMTQLVKAMDQDAERKTDCVQARGDKRSCWGDLAGAKGTDGQPLDLTSWIKAKAQGSAAQDWLVDMIGQLTQGKDGRFEAALAAAGRAEGTVPPLSQLEVGPVAFVQIMHKAVEANQGEAQSLEVPTPPAGANALVPSGQQSASVPGQQASVAKSLEYLVIENAPYQVVDLVATAEAVADAARQAVKEELELLNAPAPYYNGDLLMTEENSRKVVNYDAMNICASRGLERTCFQQVASEGWAWVEAHGRNLEGVGDYMRSIAPAPAQQAPIQQPVQQVTQPAWQQSPSQNPSPYVAPQSSRPDDEAITVVQNWLDGHPEWSAEQKQQRGSDALNCYNSGGSLDTCTSTR